MMKPPCLLYTKPGGTHLRERIPPSRSFALPGVRTMPADEVSREIWLSGDLWNTSMHTIIRCGEGDPRFSLAYMPMRNRVEVSRLMLEDCQCPYEFEVIGFKRWQDIKPKTPLGKVPVLYNFDGKGNDLAQESAITRFLARKLGLCGKSDEEEALVDMLYTQFFCTLRNNGLTHDGEHYAVTALKEAPPELVKSRRSYQMMHRVNNWTVAERSLAALGVFEDRLKLSKAGFLVGDAVTYVDHALLHILLELAEPENVPDFAERFELPFLGQFLRRMEQRPGIAAYVRSSRRMPRYTRPGYVYCPGKYSDRPV